MTESDESKPGFLRRVWGAVNWVILGSLGISLLLLLFATQPMLSSPGAPVAWYWISVAVVAVALAVLAPPIFFQLPKAVKIGSYPGLLASLIFLVAMFGQVQAAYDRTPEGAVIAAKRAAERAAQEEAEQRKAESLAALQEANDTLEQLNEIQKQQEGCLSWGGEVRELSALVRDNLNNPRSFEHVSTEFVVPGPDRFNVLMTFRAENGFGATITSRVKARMVPATCEILDVSQPG